MKNELMARAMTHIDDALIEEANEIAVSRKWFMRSEFTKRLYQYGSLAACAVLIIGVLLMSGLGGSDVLLYGESISESPQMITVYMPRAVTYSIDPALLTEVNLPLEFDFLKKTELKLDTGTMIVLDEEGNTVFEGTDYEAKGHISVCITLPAEETKCRIETNRGYNIVLSQDEHSGLWYVNIEK